MQMARIVERAAAWSEVKAIALHIGTRRPSAARRFLNAVQKTYERLSVMPALGSVWDEDDPRFAGVRYIAIPRYRKYVVFYRALDDGVEILHVLHGARDLRAFLLDDEP